MAARTLRLVPLGREVRPFHTGVLFLTNAVHRHRLLLGIGADGPLGKVERGLEQPPVHVPLTERHAVQLNRVSEVVTPDDVFDDVLAPEPREVSHTEVLERWEDRLRIVIVNV